MEKYYKATSFILLGVVVITALSGHASLAVAGLAIYLTGKELQ